MSRSLTFERRQLAQAQPAAVKNLHDRGVAQRHPDRRALRAFGTRSGAASSSSICVCVRTSGSFFSGFRQLQLPHRIDASVLFARREIDKRCATRRTAGGCRSAPASLHQLEEVIAKIVRACISATRSPSSAKCVNACDNERSFAQTHSVPLRGSAQTLRQRSFFRGSCCASTSRAVEESPPTRRCRRWR